MLRINVVTRTGEKFEIETDGGLTVMESLRAKNIGDIQAICGGNCACGTCHVYVEPAFSEALPPISEQEDALLDSSYYRTEHSRLSCQLIMSADLDGISVTVAPED